MDGLILQDLEYGFPALDQATEFGLQTNCSYLDILQYEGSNGTVSQNPKGSLDDVGLQSWLTKDITQSLEQQQADPDQASCIGGLRLLFGHCTFDAERSCRVLPFREPTFRLIEQKLKIPDQFFLAIRGQISCAFRVSNPSLDNVDASHSTSFFFKFVIFQPVYYQITLNYSPVTKLTCGLIIAKTRHHDFETIVRSLGQHESFITHPLLLPVLVADLNIASSTKRIHTANWLLNEVEEMTGQHQGINRPIGDPFKLDYTATIRKINTASRTLSAEVMRVKGILVNMDRIIHESEKLIIASDLLTLLRPLAS